MITDNVQNTSDAINVSVNNLALKLDSENTMLRYLIWAIPSLGFVGTVRGIGQALSNADKALAGDISGMSDLSSRMSVASDNLRQTLPIFMTFAVLSVVMDVDNLILAKTWFGIRIVYLIGAAINLYSIPIIRPVIWIPSIVVLVMMGLNLCTG